MNLIYKKERQLTEYTGSNLGTTRLAICGCTLTQF